MKYISKHVMIGENYPVYICDEIARASQIRILSCPNDTSIHELLDLLANYRVLHMVLQGPRVRLSLLQDLLHDGIIHDTLESIKRGEQLTTRKNRQRLTATSGSRMALCNVSS